MRSYNGYYNETAVGLIRTRLSAFRIIADVGCRNRTQRRHPNHCGEEVEQQFLGSETNGLRDKAARRRGPLCYWMKTEPKAV